MAPRVLTMAMASMAEDEKKADGKARRAHPAALSPAVTVKKRFVAEIHLAYGQ